MSPIVALLSQAKSLTTGTEALPLIDVPFRSLRAIAFRWCPANDSFSLAITSYAGPSSIPTVVAGLSQAKSFPVEAYASPESGAPLLIVTAISFWWCPACNLRAIARALSVLECSVAAIVACLPQADGLLTINASLGALVPVPSRLASTGARVLLESPYFALTTVLIDALMTTELVFPSSWALNCSSFRTTMSSRSLAPLLWTLGRDRSHNAFLFLGRPVFLRYRAWIWFRHTYDLAFFFELVPLVSSRALNRLMGGLAYSNQCVLLRLPATKRTHDFFR